MSKKSSKTDLTKTLSKSATKLINKTGSTTSKIIKDTGETGEKAMKYTSKKISNTLGKQEPLVIDLQTIKLTLQISSIIQIIIFSIFLSYIYKLEKDNCKCSKGWEREYIKYYSIVIILFSIIRIIFPFIYASMNIIHTIIGIGGIVFIFSVVKYINDLKKEDCGCSKNWKRSALNIYAWLCIILLILTFVGTLVLSSQIKN